MNQIVQPSDTIPYTHSDFLTETTLQEGSVAISRSIANIARASGSYSEASVRFGIALGSAVNIERNSRINHQHRLRLALGSVGLSYPTLIEGEVIVERAFANFSRVCEGMTQKEWEKIKILGGKGLSAELGQVEQFGSWEGVEELDAAADSLKNSDLLEELNLELVKEFEHDGEGKIDYEYRAVSSDARYVSVERMRPSKNYWQNRRGKKDGRELQEIKSALLIVDTEQVSSSQRALLGEILQSDTKKRKAERKRFGIEVVEPLMLDHSLRSRDFKLFPVSAIHFALSRYDQ